ncbi:MAG: zf-HC2 domain-containing protein [Anaerolineae bacterium]|nr:MAG: zf-HC2 domain-containing protein [Anaerolineae bacterium]
MDCQTLIHYLSDYIDRELDEALAAEARDHLATCPNCSIVLDSTQKMILMSKFTGQVAIPKTRRAKLWSEIEAAFRERKAED